MQHEVRRAGGQPDRHRAADGLAAKGRYGGCQQQLEAGVVGRQPGAQGTAPVEQAIAAPQNAAGRIVGLDDAPAPVEVEHGDTGGVEQLGKGSAQGTGIDQRLANVDEPADVGQEALDHFDLSRPPATSRNGVGRHPDDARPLRTIQACVQTVLPTHSEQIFIVGRGCLQLLFGV